MVGSLFSGKPVDPVTACQTQVQLLYRAFRGGQLRNDYRLSFVAIFWCTPVLANACDEWNSASFFDDATPENVTSCVEAGTDVNERNLSGSAPLDLAISFSDDPAVIRALAELGADLDAPDSLGWPPMHRAICCGVDSNMDFVEILVNAGADLESRDNDGDTPLHFAAENTDNPALIEFLIKSGADQHSRNEFEFTPLHSAASGGNTAIVDYLVKLGVDVNARDVLGDTPLHTAFFSGSPNASIVTTLIEAGADLEARDEYGETPLHYVARDDPVLVRLLLDAGSDPLARDASGQNCSPCRGISQ